ncbi:MAG: tetratricopeptide repeat protein, partial [Bradymonadaceae bacterium]
ACAETDAPGATPSETAETSEAALEDEESDAFPFDRMLEDATDEEAKRAIRGCADGFAKACYRVGDRYHGGDGVPRDTDLSVELIDHACSKGYRRACYDMGTRYFQGVEVDQSMGKARMYFEQTCRNGYPEACHMLARTVRDGLGGPRNLDRARRLFGRACQLGFAKDCEREPAKIRAALGPHELQLPDDAPEPIVAAARRCDSGLMSGCTDLAAAYETGRGVAENFDRAEKLYELAWDWGKLEACTSFRMLEGSIGRFPGVKP